MFTTDPRFDSGRGHNRSESERCSRSGAAADDLGDPHLALRVRGRRARDRRPARGRRRSSASELAADTGSDEPSLYRVLRALAALGVFAESEGRRFELTAIGERLRSGAPGGHAERGPRSWRRSAAFARSPTSWRRSGPVGPGLEIESGCGVFRAPRRTAARRPRCSTPQCRSGRRRMRRASPQACDFSDVRTVVDVGGGDGTLLVEILRRHAHLSGVLFEAPEVAARADALLDATDLADRCEVRAGDFFERVPAEAPTATCSRTSSTTGTTPGRPRSFATAASRDVDRGPGVDRRAADPRGRRRPGADAAQRYQHARARPEERSERTASTERCCEAAGLRPAAAHQVAFPYGVIEGTAA